MPCRDDRDDYRDNPVSQRLIEKVDKLTELLCYIMGDLEGSNFLTLKSNELKGEGTFGDLMNWWEEHKRLDTAREAKEEAERQESTKRAELLVRLNKEFNLEELDELKDLF